MKTDKWIIEMPEGINSGDFDDMAAILADNMCPDLILQGIRNARRVKLDES